MELWIFQYYCSLGQFLDPSFLNPFLNYSILQLPLKFLWKFVKNVYTYINSMRHSQLTFNCSTALCSLSLLLQGRMSPFYCYLVIPDVNLVLLLLQSTILYAILIINFNLTRSIGNGVIYPSSLLWIRGDLSGLDRIIVGHGHQSPAPGPSPNS